MVNDQSMFNTDCPHCGVSLQLQGRKLRVALTRSQRAANLASYASLAPILLFSPPFAHIVVQALKQGVPEISDSGKATCPQCRKNFELKNLNQNLGICPTPSCRNVTSLNYPFCESCFRPFNEYSDTDKSSNVKIISTINELHIFISGCNKIQVGTYVIFKNQISQNISKAWNQLKKRHGKFKRVVGDAVSSLGSDAASSATKVVKVFIDGQAFQTDEKDAYYAVPLSREAEKIYDQGLRLKYNDGERVIFRKDISSE
jgi:hypothetical protein